jgi:hypothetical protein
MHANMKKIIIITSTALVVIFFTSCGVKTEKEKLVIQDPVLIGNPLIVING